MVATWTRRNWHFLVAVLALSAVVVPMIPLGLGSWDAWGVIRSTNALVEQGIFSVSRPPGHPTVEFVFLPALARALRAFGLPFGPESYLVQLWLVSATSLVLFMKLMERVGVSPRDSLLAAACLVLAPAFLAQSANGEETTWALALLLGAWLVLLPSRQGKDDPPSHARVAIAGALLALAVGARPEVGVMGLPFAWFVLRRASRPIPDVVLYCGAFAVVSCLLWIPVVAAGSPLTPIPLTTDWRTRLVGAGYKHLFLILPFPASIVLWAGFFVALYRWRRCPDSPGRSFVAIIWVVPVMFALMFFVYPTKPAFCVPGIAFLLLVLAVARARTWLTLGLVFLVLALAIRVDLFRDRVFVGPTLMQGEIPWLVRSKPRGQLGTLARAIILTDEPKTVVLVRLVTSELDWLIAQHHTSLRRVSFASGGRTHILYKNSPTGASFLVPGDASGDFDWWRELAHQGYSFLLDGDMYRSLFSPYSVHEQPKAGDRVSVPFDGGKLDCILF